MSGSETEDAERSQPVGFDRSRITDSVQQAFNPKPLVWGDAGDGLPAPELRGHLPIVPPLSTDTFVCLADESEFVLRTKRWGDVVGRFSPDVVTRSSNGQHFVRFEDAIASGAPWGEVFHALDIRSGRVRVEPIRPQCRWLAQQMTDFGADSSHQNLERLCTARRDEDSFFVGLQDTQVHACELRSPRDEQSDGRIRIMNETKIRLGRERVQETGESFDVDKALRDHQDAAIKEGLTTSSIFREGDR